MQDAQRVVQPGNSLLEIDFFVSIPGFEKEFNGSGIVIPEAVGIGQVGQGPADFLPVLQFGVDLDRPLVAVLGLQSVFEKPEDIAKSIQCAGAALPVACRLAGRESLLQGCTGLLKPAAPVVQKGQVVESVRQEFPGLLIPGFYQGFLG